MLHEIPHADKLRQIELNFQMEKVQKQIMDLTIAVSSAINDRMKNPVAHLRYVRVCIDKYEHAAVKSIQDMLKVNGYTTKIEEPVFDDRYPNDVTLDKTMIISW